MLIFLPVWASSFPFLIARRCALYCSIVFQLILYFAQLGNKFTRLDLRF